MPIYEYRCENGHLFEVMQKIADPPVTACATCAAAVQRVFHPIAVHFKGSGFYNTDYGTAKRKREKEAADKQGSKDSKDSKDSNDSKDSKDKSSKDSGASSSGSSGSSSSSSSSASSSPSAGSAD